MLPQVPFLAKTIVSWTGEQDGDLGFLENEMVKVFHIVDELWWQGSLLRNGAEGMFPKDFATPVSNPNTPTGPNSKISKTIKSGPSTPSKDPRQNKIMANANGSFVNMASTNIYGANSRHLPMLKSAPALNEIYDSSFDDAETSFRNDNSFSRNDTSFNRNDSPGRNRARKEKRLSQLYSQYVLSSGLTKAQTTDNLLETGRMPAFSPDATPVKMRQDAIRGMDRNDYSRDYREHKGQDVRGSREDFMQSISAKKQQLEMELHALRQLERSHRQNMPNLIDSSYMSEDLLLSLRNCVNQDDLGNKLESDPETEDLVPPPPPPKHKGSAPFDADDFRASGASYSGEASNMPEDLKASLKSLQSDVLNLSELSATSAGSFMRHKYERDLQDYRREIADSEMRMSRISITEKDDVMDVVFKEKKPKQNIFKMLKKKKQEPNLMEQRLQQEHDSWQKVKVDLNRMNSLTLLDKQARTKRAVRYEPNFIVKPLEYVTEINLSETFGPDETSQMNDLRVNVRKVNEFLEKYNVQSDFNDLISDISVKFGSWRPNEIRAALLHLCKFRIIEEPEKISQTKPRLHEIMAKGEATIFQLNYLLKKFLAALGIPSEVVLGFWKKPNEFYHSDQFTVNHCWLSVMLETDERGNGCFRLIDLMCFQNGSICNKRGFNEHYFMAQPIDLISTHLPSVIELQHVTPPVDLNITFYLPRFYSGFKKNNLAFNNFNNALTRMHDLEFFEADILVPTDVELFTLIKTSNSTTNDYTLCQIYWVGQKRMAKVKAILPDNEEIGVLQIFAGSKGTQTHFDNIHELACVVPLYHTGNGKLCKFVPRFPTIQSQKNDLYIKHPQLSTISAKNAYNFEVDVHPSMGINSGSRLMNQDFKLVIESPSGKYTKLTKQESQEPFGTYSSSLICQEPGTYRALVIGDSGNSWYVFAQWECA